MGPLSAPAGEGRARHDKCQDRERCTGPGCRVRSGKTYHKRTGTPTAKNQAELATVAKAENQESAA